MQNRKINWLFLILLLLLLCLVFTGCTQPRITGSADELKLYQWQNKDEYGKTATLTFNKNEAAFSMVSHDAAVKIEGPAIVDETTIKITDESLLSAYTFTYELFGNEIKLSYGENTITLQKK